MPHLPLSPHLDFRHTSRTLNNMQPSLAIDRAVEIDVKEEVAHIDEKAAPVEVDPRLAGIADELAWARALNEDEFADEQKKLLRKVRRSSKSSTGDRRIADRAGRLAPDADPLCSDCAQLP